MAAPLSLAFLTNHQHGHSERSEESVFTVFVIEGLPPLSHSVNK